MFSNPISFPRVNLLRWTNSGSKSKKKESLANVDHNLKYIYKVPGRTNADLLKSVFDSYFHGS
jgi:hypothetical protein